MIRHLVTVSLFALIACLIVTPRAWAIDPLPFKDRAQEVRFQNLTKQLRCLVCQNESLADSTADLARDLRHDVFRQMQAGKSDAQIKDWLTARYSDYVLYDPPLRPGTWLLWFSPFVLVLIGAIVVWRILRKRASGNPPLPESEEDW